MRNYPNILVINNQSIYNNNATSITLRSILGSWPEDNLYEMHMDRNVSETKHSSYIVELVPFYNIMRKIHTMLREKKESKNKKTSNKKDRNESYSRGSYSILNSIVDASPVSIKINWNSYLNGFTPDIIYTCGGSVSIMKIALKAARKYHVPIVLHFMDDWPHHLQNEQGVVQQIYKRILYKWLKKCYEKSIIDFVISPYMAVDYEAETGIPHVPLMNAVSVKEFANQPKDPKEAHVFTYAGGLHSERWRALKEIEEVLEGFIQKGYPFKLKIYTNLKSNSQIQHFNNAITEFHEAVPHEEVNKIMQEADVLVHAETQSLAVLRFFKYSISTKIPEYMASNRPILFYGHRQMRLLQYLNEHRMAFVASDKKELESCITEIIENVEKVEIIRDNAYNYAIENHELAKVQETFYLTICKVVNYKF